MVVSIIVNIIIKICATVKSLFHAYLTQNAVKQFGFSDVDDGIR